MAASTISKGRVTTARFKGECRACDAPITAGQKIRFSKATGATCVDCSVEAGGNWVDEFVPCWRGGRCEDAPCCGCGQP